MYSVPQILSDVSKFSDKEKEDFGASFLPMTYSAYLVEIFETKDKSLIEGMVEGLITDACALTAWLVDAPLEHCEANPTEGAYIVQEVRDYLKEKIRNHFNKGENNGQGNSDSGVSQESSI